MARRISLEPHLTIEEREGRSRSTKDPSGGAQPLGSHGHLLWLLARGLTAKVIASITGYSAYWIGHIARRYNEHGPDGVKDLRHQSRPSMPLLSASQQDALGAALASGSAPQGIAGVSGWSPPGSANVSADASVGTYLRLLGARWRGPRPRRAQADSQIPLAQADFKQQQRPLLRQVAIAFPQATVELWAWGTGRNFGSGSSQF